MSDQLNAGKTPFLKAVAPVLLQQHSRQVFAHKVKHYQTNEATKKAPNRSKPDLFEGNKTLLLRTR